MPDERRAGPTGRLEGSKFLGEVDRCSATSLARAVPGQDLLLTWFDLAEVFFPNCDDRGSVVVLSFEAEVL